jgi:hypothetical protein
MGLYTGRDANQLDEQRIVQAAIREMRGQRGGFYGRSMPADPHPGGHEVAGVWVAWFFSGDLAGVNPVEP